MSYGIAACRIVVNLFLLGLCLGLRLRTDSGISSNKKEEKRWRNRSSGRQLGKKLGLAGLDFDSDNNLIVTHMFTHQVRKINPVNGEILEVVDGAGLLPDDIVVAPNGYWYWTDLGGNVFQRPPGGKPDSFYQKKVDQYHFTDPITIDDTGRYLFFAECFPLQLDNGLYRRDLVTGETKQIVFNMPFCASGGMNWYNGSLYATLPRWALDPPSIYKITPVPGTDFGRWIWRNVTRALFTATYVDFDSKGNMYANDYFDSVIYKVDYESNDLENNIEVFATTPAPVDTMTIDKDDRLYASSALGEFVFEVLNQTEIRRVYPPQKKN